MCSVFCWMTPHQQFSTRPTTGWNTAAGLECPLALVLYYVTVFGNITNNGFNYANIFMVLGNIGKPLSLDESKLNK